MRIKSFIFFLWASLFCLPSLAACPSAGTCSQCACTVSSSSSLIDFGSINILSSTPSTTAITGTVTCTNNGNGTRTVKFYATFGSGSGSILQRYMKSSNGNMFYNLYKDSSYTQVLGDCNTGNLITANFTLAKKATASSTFTIYGRIPTGQNTVKAGSYSDSLPITFNY